MDRFKQVNKSLRKDRKETELNTRRIQANLPSVERKLDTIAGEQPYRLEFPLSAHKHHVRLDLRVRPDNCCDCDPGAQAQQRDAFGFFNWNDYYPTANGEKQLVRFTEPLQQTGTTFHYGYQSPFFTPFYHDFLPIAGYSIDPVTQGVVIPIDGIYAVLFTNIITTVTNGTSYMVLSINQNGESISQRTYTVASGTLPLGTSSRRYYQYAFCVPLRKDDIVQPGIQADMIFIEAEPGFGAGGASIENTTRYTLMGLGFGVLIGLVYDQSTGLPISGATVSYTMGFGGSTTTNSDGRYEFFEITPGPYSVTASKSGYVSMTRDVTVPFDDIASLDFNLSPV